MQYNYENIIQEYDICEKIFNSFLPELEFQSVDFVRKLLSMTVDEIRIRIDENNLGNNQKPRTSLGCSTYSRRFEVMKKMDFFSSLIFFLRKSHNQLNHSIKCQQFKFVPF